MMKKLTLLLVLIGFVWLAAADVLIYGDTRKHSDVHRVLIQQVKDLTLELAFHTGDQNQKGQTQAEYDSFKEIISPLKDIFYPVRGNHEKDLELYQQNFAVASEKSYYALEHDSLKYIVLDSNLDLLPGSEQYNWLTEQLAASELPKILLLHHPVLSSGHHGQELGLELYLPVLLKKHKVLAVFCAHDHDFEHLVFDGIHYFVTGGGGAPLRDMGELSPYSLYFEKIHHYIIMRKDESKLSLQTFDLQGKSIYTYQIPLEPEAHE